MPGEKDERYFEKLSRSELNEDGNGECASCGCPYPRGNCWTAFEAENKRLRSALQGLVDSLAANDEDGLTEFAEPMAAARAALK